MQTAKLARIRDNIQIQSGLLQYIIHFFLFLFGSGEVNTKYVQINTKCVLYSHPHTLLSGIKENNKTKK